MPHFQGQLMAFHTCRDQMIGVIMRPMVLTTLHVLAEDTNLLLALKTISSLQAHRHSTNCSIPQEARVQHAAQSVVVIHDVHVFQIRSFDVTDQPRIDSGLVESPISIRHGQKISLRWEQIPTSYPINDRKFILLKHRDSGVIQSKIVVSLKRLGDRALRHLAAHNVKGNTRSLRRLAEFPCCFSSRRHVHEADNPLAKQLQQALLRWQTNVQ
mmetsp:Transcript_58413/g.156145  ORF Transcript_58413/g.156145 Transcript_58413/m.156145 type:complete len:213 (-) Transcript_58413:521-1159(-)